MAGQLRPEFNQESPEFQSGIPPIPQESRCTGADWPHFIAVCPWLPSGATPPLLPFLWVLKPPLPSCMDTCSLSSAGSAPSSHLCLLPQHHTAGPHWPYTPPSCTLVSSVVASHTLHSSMSTLTVPPSTPHSCLRSALWLVPPIRAPEQIDRILSPTPTLGQARSPEIELVTPRAAVTQEGHAG